MRRLIVFLALACLLTASAAEAGSRIMAYSSATMVNNAIWTTDAVSTVDSPNMSICVGFRSGTGIDTGALNVVVQGSFDGTNFAALYTTWAAITPTTDATYYIASSPLMSYFMGNAAASYPCIPAPYIRLVITNNTGLSITVVRAAFIHYQTLG